MLNLLVLKTFKWWKMDGLFQAADTGGTSVNKAL